MPPSKNDDRLSILEGEVNAGASHAEVVIPAIDNVPAEIRYPANVRRDANFEAATKLPHSTRFILFADGFRHTKSVMGTIVVATKDSTAARPYIGRKTGAGNRVTQGQRSENSADSMAVAAMREFGDTKILDIVSLPCAARPKPSIPMPK